MDGVDVSGNESATAVPDAAALPGAAVDGTEPRRDELAFRQRRLAFRAWHRGTREADLMIGGFFDRHAAGWNLPEVAWFEMLLEEQDVDIMAWAIGTAMPPPRFAGSQMAALQTLDYVAKSMR